MNGNFEKREEGAVPFQIGGEEFNKMFVLVDGNYPKYSRFVKAIAEPILHKEKCFTGWQEGARKDVERAFWNFTGEVPRPRKSHQIDVLDGFCALVLRMLDTPQYVCF